MTVLPVKSTRAAPAGAGTSLFLPTRARVYLELGVVERHCISESGVPDGQPMLFAHGFGCDQNMWRLVAPRFEDRCRVVLEEHRNGLDLIARALLEHETIDGAEVTRLIDVSKNTSVSTNTNGGDDVQADAERSVTTPPAPPT